MSATLEAAFDPVPADSRVVSLDVLRGIAVLGILVMNIQSFAMPEAAYSNPAAWPSLEGPNFHVWLLAHLFVEQKMMTLFALLFGAGIALQAQRTSRGAEVPRLSPAAIHYRRMAILLGLGIAHAYLLWFGDILFAYAICGMLVFPLRRLSPPALLAAGVTVLAFQNLVSYVDTGPAPSDTLYRLRHLLRAMDVTRFTVHQELAFYRGGYLEQMTHRVPEAFTFQTYVLLAYSLWRSAGLMLVGMGLLGFLTNRLPRWVLYGTLAAGGAFGLALTGFGLVEDVHHQWADTNYFYSALYDYWASIPLALAYAAAVLLVLRSRMAKLLAPFAPVGRMALTNYLLQTLICTTIFYGHGFGRFGAVDRLGQVQVVLWVWCFQLAFSAAWLTYFRFGPTEWLWRALTYGHAPPLRRER